MKNLIKDIWDYLKLCAFAFGLLIVTYIAMFIICLFVIAIQENTLNINVVDTIVSVSTLVLCLIFASIGWWTVGKELIEMT